MKTYYIGLDVHDNNIEVAVDHKGEIIARHALPTEIKALVEALETVPGRKHVALEESTLSGWIYRNLKDRVDSIIVSDPRRNKLIACEGDKNDRIDAAKLAALLRGRFLRPVYHTQDEERLELKHWTATYHNRVRQAVRCVNRLRAQGRLYGLAIPAVALREPDRRQAWLSSLTSQELAQRLALYWDELDFLRSQVRCCKQALIRGGRKEPIVAVWSQLPGIGVVRAVTLLAYLDTPFRFKKKTQLWKYCGLGLISQTSGKDKRGRQKKGYLKLEWYCNRHLKNIIMGAAMSAIRQKNNVFHDYYRALLQKGLTPPNARHAVARKMLTVMWGMWKSSRPFSLEVFHYHQPS